MLYTRKHGYGKMGAISVLGTSWVRILPGYRCMHTPGVPVFAQKNFSQYVSGRIQYKLGTDGTKTKSNGVVSTRFLLLSYSILTPLSQAEPLNSLSQAKPLDSLSHFLTLPMTGDGRCSDCGLATTEGALILISLLNMKDEAEERNRRGKR